MKGATQMTTTMEKSATVAKGLAKSGMRAKGYAHGPLGKDIMALRIGPLDAKKPKEHGIRLWTGAADCDISDIAKPNRQAVVAINEAERSITRSYNVTQEARFWGTTPSVRSLASAAFPVTLPRTARFKLDRQTIIS
jgi:hypothetical protein